LCDVDAEQLDGSRRRGELAGDDVEERRLPGAVRPENRPALALANVEVDVAHGLDAAEAPADPPKTEDRLGAFGYAIGCYRHAGMLRSATAAASS
jgi:hypothetical protein